MPNMPRVNIYLVIASKMRSLETKVTVESECREAGEKGEAAGAKEAAAISKREASSEEAAEAEVAEEEAAGEDTTIDQRER